ncbi:cysteine--tRNA ligase [Nocardioides marmoribigeumensis]|uniref:Cysteinyl-tRNA synthetase n=1 Tax=Nocardioides marmoribigeumensis TaxID=433649 RepID=A0ABU2C0V3_9ACTN|nr:cysteine--tRNA ligase [Nocardioides marmoribigeumensis]MDR7364293.1 cysteinyl-tRNA synthetase [Nocardioides marmoribigeumensis]
MSTSGQTPHHLSSSGVIGSGGRYPLHERPARSLRIGGTPVLPVGPLRVYSCGITPYDVTHVGHAATFVWADAVAAVGRASGAEVLLARNVTDVDDVLTEAAARKGWPYDELASTQEFLFDRDMRALAVAPPQVAPHARSHVTAVIRLASALLERGAAYEAAGHVWFRGADLFEAAGLDPETALRLSQEYGDQPDGPAADARESVFDVPVWRPSSEDVPAWPSPWGWGRPGWHAECAAMAMCSLGSSVEVLLGGQDLAFPHHAYQSRMVETASGATPFAQTVVHVGEVRVEGRKMAKSVGNLVLVADLLERFSGSALRLGLLHRRWSEPWECTDEVFAEADSVLTGLRKAAGGSLPPRHHDAVLDRLVDDLDVPGAVALALEQGGEAAAYLLDVLELHRD